jgi:hypothetical protein
MLLVLAALLAASLGIFLVRGREAIARRDQAHADLLERERRFETELQRNGAPDEREFAGLLAEHERLTGRVRDRLAQLGLGSSATPRPRLPELLAAARAPALRPGGALHLALLAQAGLSADGATPTAPATPQEQALAAIVAALGPDSGGLDVAALELKGGGAPAALPDLPQLQHVEAQLVLSGALPDVLHALESLAPGAEAALPAVSVLDASLRRIEPTRWGDSLALLATPPVRLTASLDVIFAAAGGP